MVRSRQNRSNFGRMNILRLKRYAAPRSLPEPLIHLPDYLFNFSGCFIVHIVSAAHSITSFRLQSILLYLYYPALSTYLVIRTRNFRHIVGSGCLLAFKMFSRRNMGLPRINTESILNTADIRNQSLPLTLSSLDRSCSDTIYDILLQKAIHNYNRQYHQHNTCT